MYQPYPSSGQPVEPLRPPAPTSVLTAVKLMYAGAAVSAVELIIGLALIIVDIKAAARGRFLGHSLAAQKPLVIMVWIVFGLVMIALWLWMARANGQGRNWARILSTVLFGLATLQLRGDFTQPVSHTGIRRDGAVLRQHGVVRRSLAGRRCCGVAALAPGLQRVLQAAGLHAGPAASSVSRVDLRARAGVACRAPGGLAGQGRAGTLLVSVMALDPL